MNSYLDFPHAAQVFAIRRDTTNLVSSEFHSETVYGITSLGSASADPSRVLSLSRDHWSIENRLHWVRDMSFDEDRCRIRRGAGAQVMASLRNLAISLLRMAGAESIAPALRRCARSDSLSFRLIGLEGL